MQIPVQVTFRGLDRSEAVEAKALERAAKLERFFDSIISCRVVVEAGPRHQRKGNLYRVLVDVTVPGRELAASRGPDQHHAHEDVYVALRDAFDAMRRQLEDHARRSRGREKRHEVPPHGRVSAISLDQGNGTIQTSDGREVRFSRNSVVGDHFDRLQVGDEVRFTDADQAPEPAASTVHVIGKHHPVG
jgi:ribosomal subunit interface protein